MKITVDIDCTPQEARTFLGLPEVEKMQEAVMKELQAKMLENIANLDPENMMKTWLPAGIQGFEQMQKMFWSQFNKGENEGK
ncbi:hypothetical protein J0X12_03955 [Sneathiella sp. CAU 1612]|uniref:Ribosomal protein S1 n=1 Tax=Sneathiella sedimenti TaxID=2816034 RepID=A0ABS3F2W4_9PROT|nr:DUF6489 family protein [Sneathiella sedimenti]MBO0332754.1 hypothetical protein [Sneathiella sedimenti]